MALLPEDPVRRGRLKLIALGLVFSAPVVLGWLAFLFDWVPGATGNYGELLAPKPMEHPAFDAWKGKWVLVTFDSPDCDAYCERKLYFMRQARRALGRDQLRVERLWVLTAPGVPRADLLAAIEGTQVLAPPGARFLSQFPFASAPADHVYLVDSQGFLMMRFPRDPDPSRMIRDLQRLLKYSR